MQLYCIFTYFALLFNFQRSTLKKFLKLCFFFIGFYSLGYNQIKISGIIVDEQELFVPNVKIWLHELNKGVLSNDKGYFEIQVQKRGNYHLHFTSLGYKSKILEFYLEKDTFLKVSLNTSDLELKDVVIEANIQKIIVQESSQDLSIVTQELVLKRNFDNLLKSIDRIPGINTINIGVGASKPVIRGMSFNRVVVVENGIKQEGQQWGGDHGLEIDGFNFDEIEILKGPAALFYGSDAMGGVLHIHQKAPTHEGLTLQTLQGYRSNNHSIFQTAYAAFKKNRLSFQLRHTYQNYGDYGVPSDSFIYNTYVLPIEQKRLKNTSGREWNQMFRLGYHGNVFNSLFTFTNFYQKLGFFSGAFGIPTSFSVKQDGNFRNIQLPYQKIHHWKLQTNNKILLGKNWLEIDAAWQQNIRNEFSNAHSHNQLKNDSLALGLILNTFSLNTRYFKKWKHLKWVSGLNHQYQKNHIQGFEYLIPNFQRFQFGFFQFFQYKKNEHWVSNAGLRIDFANDELQEAYVDFYRRSIYIGKQLRSPFIARNYWNYSFSLGTSYFITENWNIKWNLGSDFRYPAPSELASNGVHHGTFRHEQGNPNLLPEKGIQSDIYLHFENKKLEIKLSGFGAYFWDYIYLSPTSKFSNLPEGGQIYQYLQDHAVLWGGEIFWDYHIIDHLHASIAGDFVWGENLNRLRPLPFMPPASIVSHFEWNPNVIKWLNMELWLEHRFSFPQNRVVINEPATPAFHLFNTGLQTQKKFKEQTFTFGFQIQNLFNRPYFYHLSKYRLLNIYEPARNYVIQLQWKLK